MDNLDKKAPNYIKHINKITKILNKFTGENGEMIEDFDEIEAKKLVEKQIEQDVLDEIFGKK